MLALMETRKRAISLMIVAYLQKNEGLRLQNAGGQAPNLTKRKPRLARGGRLWLAHCVVRSNTGSHKLLLANSSSMARSQELVLSASVACQIVPVAPQMRCGYRDQYKIDQGCAPGASNLCPDLRHVVAPGTGMIAKVPLAATGAFHHFFTGVS